jgi:carbon-monoxide dehydrogenase medium subunit
MTFAFHRPQTMPEAFALLSSVSDSMPLAGGMTLLPTIKQRLAAPAALIDLSKIPQLSGIAVEGDTLVIGAMVRHVDVAESDVVRGSVPLLANLAVGIGDPAVRNRGTIGGSVANNDPSADYPAAVLALGATVVTDRREIAADDFFTGLFETALQPNEVITSLRFPIPAAGG